MPELIRVTRKYMRSLYPHAPDDLLDKKVEQFITRCIILNVNIKETIKVLS